MLHHNFFISHHDQDYYINAVVLHMFHYIAIAPAVCLVYWLTLVSVKTRGRGRANATATTTWRTKVQKPLHSQVENVHSPDLLKRNV